ncbi:MAG: hypothetical protein ACOH5I_23740 [Oligoflexus sp.]
MKLFERPKKALVMWLGMSLSCSVTAMAEEVNISNFQRLNFAYDAELSLVLFDALDPNALSQTINQTANSSNGSSSRVLGLRRSVINLSWKHLGISELHLSLRPDAMIQRQNPPANVQREIDTRAGDTYRPAPSLQLLDTYELAIVPGDDFRLGLGVFDNFQALESAYESSLEFGLEARLPQKFAAYFVNWTLKPVDVPRLAGPGLSQSYRFTFWGFEGREDRREQIGSRRLTDDAGPVGQDPYLGGAVSFEAYPVENWQYSIVGGYSDSKVEFGRVSELFAGVAIAWQGDVLKSFSKIHWQSQWARERWRVSQARLAGLQQLSHSLTSRHHLQQNWHLLLGFQLGSSEQHATHDPGERAVSTGHKYDLGVEYLQGNFLSYQFLIATEVRARIENGVKDGAFMIDGEAQRRLNRFGLAVSYRIL